MIPGLVEPAARHATLTWVVDDACVCVCVCVCETSCDKPTADCTLNVTTVTMPIHEADPSDVARAPLGATELRTKLKSRQAMMEAAGFPDQNYNVTDGGNLTICKSINARVAAVVWDSLDNATQSHFLKYGEPLEMLDDKVCVCLCTHVLQAPPTTSACCCCVSTPCDVPACVCQCWLTCLLGTNNNNRSVQLASRVLSGFRTR